MYDGFKTSPSKTYMDKIIMHFVKEINELEVKNKSDNYCITED